MEHNPTAWKEARARLKARNLLDVAVLITKSLHVTLEDLLGWSQKRRVTLGRRTLITNLYAHGLSQNDIAFVLNRDQSTISRVINQPQTVKRQMQKSFRPL